ncbi:MAG TPA: phytanoyl-CoA dioxygenase family protein [Myxococcota bacterium]|nr:phytanoyl-CoA dioxygenase family protein [Myxococcota bacterium]
MELALHPWNRGFDWEPAAPGALPDAWCEAWNERGFFVVPDAFGPAELAPLVADLDAFDAEVSAFLETRPDKKLFVAEGGNLTFSLHPVLRSSQARKFCEHPVFAELAHALVGPDVRLYWDQAVYKKPERPGTLPWHQDNGYTYVEPQQYLTCWVALTDATEENGCPWVAPGLHRRGTLAHRLTPAGWECFADDPPGAVPVEARAGSIVVFSSLTPHKTGPNTSEAVRKAYIVQIAPDGAVALHEGLPPEPLDHPERQFRLAAGAG